jgi:hypothetical protein
LEEGSLELLLQLLLLLLLLLLLCLPCRAELSDPCSHHVDRVGNWLLRKLGRSACEKNKAG